MNLFNLFSIFGKPKTNNSQPSSSLFSRQDLIRQRNKQTLYQDPNDDNGVRNGKRLYKNLDEKSLGNTKKPADLGTENRQNNSQIGLNYNNDNKSFQITGVDRSSLVIGTPVVNKNFGILGVVSKALNPDTRTTKNSRKADARNQNQPDVSGKDTINYYKQIFKILDDKQTASPQGLNRGLRSEGVNVSPQSLNSDLGSTGISNSTQNLNRGLGSIGLNTLQSSNRGIGTGKDSLPQSLNQGLRSKGVDALQTLNRDIGTGKDSVPQSLNQDLRSKGVDTLQSSNRDIGGTDRESLQGSLDSKQPLNSSLESTSDTDGLSQNINLDQSHIVDTTNKKPDTNKKSPNLNVKSIKGSSFSGYNISSTGQNTSHISTNPYKIDDIDNKQLLSSSIFQQKNTDSYPLLSSNTGFQDYEYPEDDQLMISEDSSQGNDSKGANEISGKIKDKFKSKAKNFGKKILGNLAKKGAKAGQQAAAGLSRLLIFLADPRVLAVILAIILIILIIWLIFSALQSTQTAASIERIELYMGGSPDAALSKFSIIIGKPVGASYNPSGMVWKNAFEVDGPNGEIVKAINNIQASFQFKNSAESESRNIKIKEVELKISLPVSNFKIANFDTGASRGLQLSKNVNNIIAICRVTDNCNPYNENTFKFSIKFDDEGLNLSDLNYVMQIFYTVSKVTFQDDKTADLSMNGIRLCLGLISKGNISLVPCNVGANLVRTAGSNNTSTNNTSNPNVVDVGGSFLCPFDVTQLPYMVCTSGYFDMRFGSLHKAIDIAPQGLRGNEISIYSPVSGEVIYVYPKNLVQIRGGALIKIKDERTGYIYTLAHLENERVPLVGAIDVGVGTRVNRGQLLGVLFEPNENTSRNWSTGTHLHFSIQEPNETYIDPLPQFKAYCRLNDNFRCLR